MRNCSPYKTKSTHSYLVLESGHRAVLMIVGAGICAQDKALIAYEQAEE